MDTILCHNADVAKKLVDAIGQQYIDDWEFYPGGSIRLYLNTPMDEIPERVKKDE